MNFLLGFFNCGVAWWEIIAGLQMANFQVFVWLLTGSYEFVGL